MSKAIAIYTGGIHSLIQVAVRTDGVLFRRHQSKTRFGYAWGAWKSSGAILAAADTPPAEISGLTRATPDGANANASTLFNAKGEIRVRLP